MTSRALRPRPGLHRLDRATRWTGRLLCGCHALAMALTATEALLHPSPAWWPGLWPGAWVLTAVLLAAWAALRALQKHGLRRAAEDEGDGTPDGTPDDTPQQRSGSYDQAA
ncbi:hypothetical protein ACIQOF_37725 [Streptomyces sp. NPDC091265]|uniref:hypothetical protein n=1 Tax=unclassified Streptomyces TaxID=2593676 RepID=UPI00344D2A49